MSFQCLSVGVCCDWALVIALEKLRRSAKRGAYLILMRPQDFPLLQRVPVARTQARFIPGVSSPPPVYNDFAADFESIASAGYSFFRVFQQRSLSLRTHGVKVWSHSALMM